MRQNEEAAIAKFRADGWTEFRGAWPDYLLLRMTSDKKFEFMWVEVKHGRDPVRAAQRRMHVALLCAGIKVEVIRAGKKKQRQSILSPRL